MPLVHPISEIQDESTKQLVTFFNETLGFCPNSVLTMNKKPLMADAFINLNKAVMDNAGSISSEFKRIIAYISSNTAGCRYCQAHTIRAAQRYGGSDKRLQQAWDFENSKLFSMKEKIALRFVIASSTSPTNTQFFERELKANWSEEDILEMVSVIALFGFLNRWNDVMGTTLEEEAKQSAEQYLNEAGWEIGKHV
jgi:alkylhydroperoxidase family enzyme